MMFTIIFCTVVITAWIVGAMAFGVMSGIYRDAAEVEYKKCKEEAGRIGSSAVDRTELYLLIRITLFYWFACVATVVSAIVTIVYTIKGS